MKFVHQHDLMDCGPACLSMITSYYGRKYPLQYLRDNAYLTREGVSLSGISEAATKIGFETFSAKLSIKDLSDQKDVLPCILHWNQNHFVVLKKINKSWFGSGLRFHISDPAFGEIVLSGNRFATHWLADKQKGVALFLTPTEDFFSLAVPSEQKLKLKDILQYIFPFKKKLFFIFSLLLVGSFFTLIFPFLTQKLIDSGVNMKNLSLVSTILLAQLALYAGSISIEVIRNWLTLHIGTRVSINIVSGFIKKILRLPIRFFDTKLIGDFNQRINDTERIEHFLTSQGLLTFFSLLTFSVFFGVLWYYSFKLVFVYAILTALSLAWSLFWLKRRSILDYFRFQERSKNQEVLYEIISGVTDMKIYQFEDYKTNTWINIQEKLFKINKRILKIDQIQLSGFEFLNQVKNILVTFLSATYVINGTMTLGELVGVSYIIGQMNNPLSQMVVFFRSMQDAKLSFGRLSEIQNQDDEETSGDKILTAIPYYGVKSQSGGINIQNVSFQYEEASSPFVLQDINILIPDGKITAIVGASGSGKTTLLKLLLKFYDPNTGSILYNSKDLKDISPKSLRQSVSVVMQDGFIFSDTIERNIATSEEVIDQQKLLEAVRLANLNEFIDSLPLGFKTRIGASGNGISGGQRQRILIARAIYKDSHYLFLDEATSSLDSENEQIIHRNLQNYFKNKTVVVIAHRLSTVRNADKIIVLKHGRIVEMGKHAELVENKSDYFNLVKNQLELGD